MISWGTIPLLIFSSNLINILKFKFKYRISWARNWNLDTPVSQMSKKKKANQWKEKELMIKTLCQEYVEIT